MEIKKYTLQEVKDIVIKKVKEMDKDFIVKDTKKEGTIKISLKAKKMDMEMGLHNILQQVNFGEKLDDVLKGRMDVMMDMMKMGENMRKWSFVKDKIIFVPSTKNHMKDMNKTTEEKTKKGKTVDKIYFKGFIQDIVLAGAIDFPGYFAYLTEETIKGFKKTKDEIDEQIGKNLLKYDTKYKTDIIAGIVHIFGFDGILSTFLITPQKLREIADKNGLKDKEVVGCVPFRDLILLKENTMDNAMILWSGANQMLNDNYRPYPVSSKPFIIDKDGVISPFRSDEISGDGVIVAFDPLHGTMNTMGIGRKNSDDVFAPSPEEMEEMFRKDKKVEKILSIISNIASGIPIDKFLDRALKVTPNRQLVEHLFSESIERGLLKIKKVDGKMIVFPSKNILENLLKMGGKKKWD